MRGCLALVLIGALVVASVEAARVSPAQTPQVSFAELLAAYRGGNVDVANERLVTPADFASFLDTLGQYVKLKAAWDPKAPALMIEAAIVASQRSRLDVTRLLDAGRQIYLVRTTRVGVDARDDAFELLWHKIAIALLENLELPKSEMSYLDDLDRRYAPAQDVFMGGHHELDPWFVLARGIAGEQAAWQSSSSQSLSLAALVAPGDTSKLARNLADTARQFDAAAASRAVAVESNIRGAVTRFKLGEYDAALATLDRARPPDADQIQAYWSLLLRGRILQQLRRLPEAEQGYRDALKMWPNAESPATGLAFVLFQMNRRDEAAAAAAAVRAAPAGTFDPWWSYIPAEARFINRWHGALREMLK